MYQVRIGQPRAIEFLALMNEPRQRGVAEPLIAEAVGAIDSADIDAAAGDIQSAIDAAAGQLPPEVRSLTWVFSEPLPLSGLLTRTV